MWIPLVMLAWGGIMVSMAAIKNESGLYAGRFFLGLAESVISIFSFVRPTNIFFDCFVATKQSDLSSSWSK